MMGLATARLAEVLDEERLRIAAERSDVNRASPQAAQTARVRHQRQRRLVGLSLLPIGRASSR